MSHPTPLLQDCLTASACRLPDKVALVFGRQRVTYGELDHRSDAIASALIRAGVRRGDRVLVFADNGVEAVVSFWAVLKADAVVCIVNPLTKASKLAYYLDDTRATALISEARLAEVVVAAAAPSRYLATVILSSDALPACAARLPGLQTFAAALATGPGAVAPARRNIDIDLAAIIYTSGSTGDPKGVMLTHRNMLAAVQSITAYLHLAEYDVILGALPLAFDYGLYQMIMAFAIGARLVLERSFALVPQIVARMSKEGVTGLPGVPTVFALLAEMKTLHEFDLTRIRYITSTGATLPEKHIRWLRSRFPAARIYSMYGLTECKRCTYLPPEDIDRKPGSVGIAIPNTELWLVDECGNTLGPHQIGQLVVRGATVMRGYWEKPEATARRLKPGPLPGDFVLYTGDLCRRDEEGYLYFVERMDNIVKSRGEKVAPREIELVLMAIDGVREVAVIGVADEILGHAVKAFVVPEQGAILSTEKIEAECKRMLEITMVPKYIEILSDLPRTATGKIDKATLC